MATVSSVHRVQCPQCPQCQQCQQWQQCQQGHQGQQVQYLGAQKIQKLENGHEMDKDLMKLDENWTIWSQTVEGDLSREVLDPKMREGLSKMRAIRLPLLLCVKGV